MALRLPPLNALRLFEAAGRHISFKLAAEELHVTPSAVSHGIVSLERWLGIALFERGVRGLTLTAAGRDYLPYVSEALILIATGTQRLPSRRADRRIVISSAPTFAARLLLPRLDGFRRLHPGISVAIDTAQRQVGFPIDGVDLAIRLGHGQWPGLSATRLFGERLLPVAAPAYVASLADADGVADLARATLIHLTSATEDWSAWLDGAAVAEPRFSGLDLSRGLMLDTLQMAIEAASAGLGLMMGRRPLIDRELADGRLVAVAAAEIACTTAYWLVVAESAACRPDIAAFRHWLIAEIDRVVGG